jgi:hypothetical protein
VLVVMALAALAAAATLGTAGAVPPPGFTLTVTKAGTGAGTVVSTPPGIDCGADCTVVFPAGTSVTLKAVEGYRARFTGWSGDCSGTTCVLTMTGDHAVRATFKALDPPGCKVPRVLGLSLATAKVKLVLAHCKLGRLTRAVSTRKQKGKVVAERPKAGTKLKKGAKVSLTLGTGPKR